MDDIELHVRRAHDARPATGSRVARRHELPWSYDEINTDWLTDLICQGAPGARVVSHSFDEPDPGSTSRQRIFLTYNGEGERANLPRSIFCKATFDLKRKILLGKTGSTHSEVTFYTAVRPALDIDAPTAIFAKYDPESFASLIIMNDLAGEVTFCDHTTPVDLNRVKQQLSLLASVHAKFQQPENAARLAPLYLWTERFAGFESIGLKAACARGFEAARDIMPAELYRRKAEVWPATLMAVEMHKKLPLTLNHGDVHLKNWYFRDGAGAGLSDWQGCCRGHWSRDISYALATALRVEDRRRWERDLLRFYLDQLAEKGGEKVDFEAAFTAYRRQIFHALAWWRVTLAPAENMPDMQPSDTALEFLRRITRAVDDLESLDSFG